MSDTASTVRLDDSEGADSVVATSAKIQLFAIIPYRPTIYLLCSPLFHFRSGQKFKRPST